MAGAKYVEICRLKSSTRILAIGVIWGVLETAVVLAWLLVAAFSAESLTIHSAGAIMLLLIFSLALLSGYVLADPGETIKPLLLSQLIVLSTLLALLFIPTYSIPLSAFASLSLSVIYFAILSFLLCLAGSLPGSFLGADVGKTPIPRLLLSDYQIGLRAIFLLAIAGSMAIVGGGYIAGVNQLGAEVTFLQTVIGLQQHIPLIGGTTISWNAGTDTIMVDLGTTSGQIFQWAGYIRVSWTSTIALSFHIRIMNAYSSTNSTSSGTFNIPVVDLAAGSRAWFHNDGCSASGCPSGTVTYSIEYWY